MTGCILWKILSNFICTDIFMYMLWKVITYVKYRRKTLDNIDPWLLQVMGYQSKNEDFFLPEIDNSRLSGSDVIGGPVIRFTCASKQWWNIKRKPGKHQPHRTYIRIDITSPHGVRQKFEVHKPVMIYQLWSRGLML
jgi:hypothetical protein